MNLSSAIDYLSDKKNIERRLSSKQMEALELVLEVLQQNVNVEDWDIEYYANSRCQHCDGNGCASCKRTGEAIF